MKIYFLFIFLLSLSGPATQAKTFIGIIPQSNTNSVASKNGVTNRSKIISYLNNYKNSGKTAPQSTPSELGFVFTDSKKNSLELRTDILVHLLQSGPDLLAWVTQISTGAPLDGAAVDVYTCAGKKIRSGRTKADGTILFHQMPQALQASECRGKKSHYVFATFKGFVSVSSTDWGWGYESWRYPLLSPGRGEKPKITTLLPQVDFHAGQTVKMMHYVAHGAPTPTAVLLDNAIKKVSYKFDLEAKNSKEIPSEFTIPLDALTGTYDLRFLYTDGKTITSNQSFRVYPNYTPSVNLRITSEKSTLRENEKWFFDVEVKSFDSKQKSYPLEIQYHFSNNGLEDHCRSTINGDYVYKHTVVTDPQGKARIPIPPLHVCQKSKTLQIQAVYQDTLGQITSTYKTLSILGADHLHPFSVHTLDPEKRRAILSLSVAPEALSGGPAYYKVKSFIKNNLVTRKKLLGSNYSLEIPKNLIPLDSSCEGTLTSSAEVLCHLDNLPAQELIFQLDMIHQDKTEHRREISEARLAPTRWPSFQATKQLVLQTDKLFYSDDENIKLKIISPIKEAQALIVIEQDRILDHMLVDIKDYQTNVELPQKKNYFPNIFITALLFRKKIENKEQFFTDALTSSYLKVGLTQSYFERQSRRIPLSLTTEKKSLSPRDSVEVKINLQRSGLSQSDLKKTNVVLFAVTAKNQSPNSSLFISDNLRPEISLQHSISTSQNTILGFIDAAQRFPVTGAPPLNRLQYPLSLTDDNNLLLWETKLKPNSSGEINYKFKVPNIRSNFYLVAVASIEGRKFGTSILPITLSIENEVEFPLAPEGLKTPKPLASPNKAHGLIAMADTPVMYDPLKRPQVSSVKSEDRDNTSPHQISEIRKSYQPSDIFILDRNNLILKWERQNFNYRSFPWLDIESISPVFIRLLLAAEDKDFFEHQGVDWTSLAKAGLHYINPSGPRIGASTITMQLATLLNKQTNAKVKSLTDKLDQIKSAFAIEKNWTKNEILEAYVNLVPLRGELIGVHVASYKFFNKPPKDLNARESALLVAMIRSPNANPTQLTRRTCLLIPTDCKDLSQYISQTIQHDYLQTPARPIPTQLFESKSEAVNRDVVQTSLDRSLQLFSENSLKRHLAQFKNQNLKDGAVLILDNRTGKVAAYVATSGNEFSTDYLVDHIQSYRQAGSTLKPFIYAAAIDKGRLTMNSILKDDFFSAAEANGESYAPRNFTLQTYGSVSAALALGSSLNIPAVKVFELSGEDTVVRHLIKLGFKNLSRNASYGPSLALGSVEVSLWELTHAYKNLLTGNYFQESTKQQINQMLAQPLYRSLTFGTESVLTMPFFAPVKTGTSNNTRDSWCLGSIGNYTIGIWTGNSGGEAPKNIGNSNAAYLWRDLAMELYLADPPQETPNKLKFQMDEPASFKNRNADQKPFKFIRPLSNEIYGIDPEFPKDHQKIPVEISGSTKGLVIELNGSPIEFNSNPIFIDAKKGRSILKLINHESKVLDEVEFTVQ